MDSLLSGDCLEKLKTLKSNSIDSIVTDPPYGLSFMGKKWDYQVPSVEIWKEALRVLKPGGHLLSFGGTRTYHRMVVNIEDAGFEIRDCIQWLYGSGFPKSHNIKEGKFKGHGTALKPANEPIVVARKPLEKGLTVAQNVLKYGCGAINIDGSRIEAADQAVLDAAVKRMTGNSANSGAFQSSTQIKPNSAIGRWPANIVLDEAAAEMLDEQSGNRPGMSSGGKHKSDAKSGMFGKIDGNSSHIRNDSGGASRFFYVAKASKSERNAGLDECTHNECDTKCTLITKKTKQGARPGSPDATGKFPDHDHRESGGNNHPTVKPIKLMQYLINLVTPPNGTVLDPFMGSGSTGVAAKNLKRKFIGIELSQEYFEIAKKRIEQNKLNERQMDLAYG